MDYVGFTFYNDYILLKIFWIKCTLGTSGSTTATKEVVVLLQEYIGEEELWWRRINAFVDQKVNLKIVSFWSPQKFSPANNAFLTNVNNSDLGSSKISAMLTVEQWTIVPLKLCWRLFIHFTGRS